MIKRVLIALPAKDEEDLIGFTIESAMQYGDVHVFDNKSEDRTPIISKGLGATVITSPLSGYESVIYHIAEYFLKSDYEVLVILDADGEAGLDELSLGLSMLPSFDGVIGNRNVKKRFSERLICRLFFRKTNINDIYCGFKILTRKAISLELTKGTFGTALVNKTAKFQNVDTVIKYRKGSRLGNEFLVQINLLIGGLKGYFS